MRRLPGIQIPTGARALSIRLANWPVAAFVVASCSGANQNTNESGLPCPAEACASCARFRLGLRQDHRPKRMGLPPDASSAFYLQPTPPLRRLNHACDTDAPGTNPAAVAVPALVSNFVLRVPWVSSFHCLAITFLGGAVRPSYSTAMMISSLVSGYESRRSPYRETVACPQGSAAIASLPKFRHRPSQNLPASPRGPLMVELFAARFRETPGASPPDSPLSPRKKLPTPAEVRQSRLREICFPWVDYAMRCMASPTLNTDGLRQNSAARFSASPPFGANREKSYRIEIQDYSAL